MKVVKYFRNEGGRETQAELKLFELNPSIGSLQVLWRCWVQQKWMKEVVGPINR